MKCVVCGCKDTKVVDSRLSGDGDSVRRRRECEKCGFRVTTLEEVELLDVSIVKRDGRREVYSRDKLAHGLKKALEKRPYTDEQFHKLARKIERDIQKKKKKEITSQDIGELVMRQLKRFDKVAYIRFASVYRSFEDVQTFEDALQELIKTKRSRSR